MSGGKYYYKTHTKRLGNTLYEIYDTPCRFSEALVGGYTCMAQCPHFVSMDNKKKFITCAKMRRAQKVFEI